MTEARQPAESELIPEEPFLRWYEALRQRQMSDLTFPEVRRGVQALSATYVQSRKTRLESALSGAGKRAAFAMFYAPLHFLLIQAIVRELGEEARAVTKILDLGCGTGVGGAAWALEHGGRPRVRGIERNAWAVGEARWNYRQLRIDGRVDQRDLGDVGLSTKGSGVIMAFTANELEDSVRTDLKDRLIGASLEGGHILIVEPIALRLLPWWTAWAEDFEAIGGIAREWKFRANLPQELHLMDRAAGLDHQFLTGRSLWLPGKKHHASDP